MTLRSLGFAAVALGIACTAPACGGDDSTNNGPTADAGMPFPDGTSPDGTSPDGGSDGGVGTDAWAPLPPTPQDPELWYWHHAYLSVYNMSEPQASKALIDRASAAGYTGIALWDSSMSFLVKSGWDSSKLKAVVDYAVSKGLKVLSGTAPYGYSNDLLQADPNLAEGQRVVGAQFKVVASSGGNVLQPVSSLAPIPNGDFQGGGTGWFSIGDACLGIDNGTGHGDSASARLSATPGNCRLRHDITVVPWRDYHVSFWVKSQGFGQNQLTLSMLDFTDPNNTLTRFTQTADVAATQDWQRVDLAFNSRESTQLSIYMGLWGGFAGTLWIDDIGAEETALVNVLRRAGTPLKVYDGSTTYAEGTDFAMIVDPALAAHPGTYDAWHAPPVVSIPAGSRLLVGQTVSIDHYTVFPAIAGGVGVCLSEPAVQTWMHDDSVALAGIFPAGSGVFLGYDEMRHMNSCALCRSKNQTAGALLAGNVAATWMTVHGAMPGARGYLWSDMFDPHHNAVDHYYSVEGTIVGSWAGLQPGFVIMNWNLGQLTKSLTWFSGKDPMQPHAFQQIIAGYYSNGNGATEATKELMSAQGIPGVVGAMFTVWNDDYTELASYASGVKAAWPAYKASVP